MKYQRLEVLETIMSTGLVPVFYNPNSDIVRQVANATLKGGCRLFEFTNRGDGACEVFKHVTALTEKKSGHIIGVGSVVDAETAAMYVNMGAEFVVGPTFNPEVARFCNRRKVPYAPGCGTTTEIATAHEAGCEIVKVFPGESMGGPGFVKSILGPMPWTKVMPTGGVKPTQQSIFPWFEAGVVAVGIGSEMLKLTGSLQADCDAITSKTSEVLGWIRQTRNTPLFLGIEHVGLYTHPDDSATADDIAKWYGNMFGFAVLPGKSSVFVEGPGTGRIEVMRECDTDRCHLAVLVSDFDAACKQLRGMGVELEQTIEKPGVKAVYLAHRDPAGNRVHLLWRQ